MEFFNLDCGNLVAGSYIEKGTGRYIIRDEKGGVGYPSHKYDDVKPVTGKAVQQNPVGIKR